MVAGVNINAPGFLADDVAFLQCSSGLLTEAMKAAATEMTDADAAAVLAKKAAVAHTASIADAEARQNAILAATIPSVGRVNVAKKRYEALRTAFDKLNADGASGVLTLEIYLSGLESAIARDESLQSALGAAGRKAEAALIEKRLAPMKAERDALAA
jgi:hypothetical protein